MIDTSTETLLLPAQAAQAAPSRPHAATIVRWMLTGVAGGLKLESVKVGGRRYTSREALERFIERCTDPDTNTSADSYSNAGPANARRQPLLQPRQRLFRRWAVTASHRPVHSSHSAKS